MTALKYLRDYLQGRDYFEIALAAVAQSSKALKHVRLKISVCLIDDIHIQKTRLPPSYSVCEILFATIAGLAYINKKECSEVNDENNIGCTNYEDILSVFIFE